MQPMAKKACHLMKQEVRQGKGLTERTNGMTTMQLQTSEVPIKKGKSSARPKHLETCIQKLGTPPTTVSNRFMSGGEYGSSGTRQKDHPIRPRKRGYPDTQKKKPDPTSVPHDDFEKSTTLNAQGRLHNHDPSSVTSARDKTETRQPSVCVQDASTETTASPQEISQGYLLQLESRTAALERENAMLRQRRHQPGNSS